MGPGTGTSRGGGMGGASSVCLYHDRIEAARLLARSLVYHVSLVSDLGRPIGLAPIS